MSQFSGISFKSEKPARLPNPRRKLFIILSLAVLAVAGGGYGLHFYYAIHALAAADTRPVTHAAKAPAKSSTTVTNAASAAGQPELAANSSATNTANLVEAGSIPEKNTPVDLGDSLLSVLTPSARAEAVQPAFQPAKPLPQPATVAANRIPLKAQTSAAADRSQAQAAQQQLLHAAKAGYWEVMDNAVKNPDLYGFRPNDNLREAQLGDAIQVYTIPEQDRRSYQAGQPLKPLLKPTQEWVFPVTLGNRVCFMVQIRYDGHEYVIERGSRALAMVYDKIQQNWPVSEGYHPQLVMNPHLPTYYFTIPELPTPNITDTSEMFGYNPSLSPAAVILASWH